MNKINPYFELNGTKYELKRTRWLIAEYNRLNEEREISDEDKKNAVHASNLLADIQKFKQQADICWEKLCNEPTDENQRAYLMFKGMNDKAIADYNTFVATNNTLGIAAKANIDILEQVAIKALAEQYFGFNEALAKQTWESFVESQDNHAIITEWLTEMADCLFNIEDKVEENSFLYQTRKRKQRGASKNQK